MPSIHQIFNSPFNSNTYIIFDEIGDIIAIIDPGELKSDYLLNMLPKKVKSDYLNVILTHEHFDHIAGLVRLCGLYKVNLLTSKKCLENLNNPKKNLSQFLDCEIIDAINPYKVYPVIDYEIITINKINFNFYYTPGHSEGSICIGFDKSMFTGDTILESDKIITNFPGGNKNDFSITKEKLSTILQEYEYIYPGHGAAFKINH